eukprot:4720844-Amphidinium_carterae.1
MEQTACEALQFSALYCSVHEDVSEVLDIIAWRGNLRVSNFMNQIIQSSLELKETSGSGNRLLGRRACCAQ